MDDELEELRAIFLDECLENIELLEGGLMRMGEGENDLDTLNEVFRAAHSIKGGASTFGFMPMAELTHHMETLLDEMRSERRSVTESDVDLLLLALDLLQSILTAGGGTESDHPDRQDVQTKLENSVLNGGGSENQGSTDAASGGDTAESTTSAVDADSKDAEYAVKFTPNHDFYPRGNDPLLLLREIGHAGQVNANVVSSRCTQWSEYEPTESYLSFDLKVTGTKETSLREIFDWVDTDCELLIDEITNDTDNTPETAAEVDTDTAAAPAANNEERVETPDEAKETPQDAAAKDGAKSAAAADKKPKKAANANETSSIRIATDKIDQLINLVGELVITQSMLSRVSNDINGLDHDELRERLADLEHNTRDLQESVMQVRMLPISSAFSRLPRLVRDLSKKLDKNVDLQLEGGSTELDKTVLERMIDPLVHLVRNGLDHGLETTEERLAKGKSETGILKLSAHQESGSVVIEIQDDGKGIDGERILSLAKERGIVSPDEELSDDQINQLIFAPGFSTAEEVSDVSGRGVGMDVVRRNIVDLGGRVTVYSELGSGTTIEIKLPLSLAILDGQLVEVAGEVYVIPILSIIETLELEQTDHSFIPGTGEICQFRGEYLQMLRVAEHFRLPNESNENLIVVVDTHSGRYGLVVDKVLGQQQVVIKPLDKNYKNVPGLAGATIMSDGSVALILDPTSITINTNIATAA